MHLSKTTMNDIMTLIANDIDVDSVIGRAVADYIYTVLAPRWKNGETSGFLTVEEVMGLETSK